jgi:hypothetical protein
MKNFAVIIILVFLLLTFLFSISAFLGRDLILTVKNELDKRLVNTSQNQKKVISKFAVLSDTHSDSDNTRAAIIQAKSLGAEYIVHSGDWSTVGTIAELSAQKKIFDQEKISYYGIMGDHDRWQSGIRNFQQVLGSTYESFDRNGLHHILLDSSDLQNGLYKEQLDWLERDLQAIGGKPIVIFMHLPIYHPTSDRTISNKAGDSSQRDAQSQKFLDLIKGKNVVGIFSGDHHLSSSYTEPNTSVKIFISGAVTRERNLQKPRFTLVEVYQDYTLGVADQVIK